MPLASSRIRTVHKPTRAVAQSMSNKQCPIIWQPVQKPTWARPSAASTGRARWTRGGNMRIARCGFEALRRAALSFFVSHGSSALNKPSAPSARSTKGRSDHTHVRRNAGGNRRMPWKCPYASGQSFGHGPRQSHKPSATLASDTKEVAATTCRAIHRYTGRDGLVAVTRNSAKTSRRRTGTSARAGPATTSGTLESSQV